MSLYRGIIKLEPAVITDEYMNMVAQVKNEESIRITGLAASMGQIFFSPIYYFAVVTKVKSSTIPSVLSNKSRVVGVFA